LVLCNNIGLENKYKVEAALLTYTLRQTRSSLYPINSNIRDFSRVADARSNWSYAHHYSTCEVGVSQCRWSESVK